MATKIGDKVRELRKIKGLTQEQLAERSGLTKDYISRIEREDYDGFRLSTLDALADALEVHPSLLLFGKVLEPTRQLKKDGEFLVSLSKEEKSLIDKYRGLTSKKEKLMIEDVMDGLLARKKKRKSKGN